MKKGLIAVLIAANLLMLVINHTNAAASIWYIYIAELPCYLQASE